MEKADFLLLILAALVLFCSLFILAYYLVRLPTKQEAMTKLMVEYPELREEDFTVEQETFEGLMTGGVWEMSVPYKIVRTHLKCEQIGVSVMVRNEEQETNK